jgi:PAS domain S-box-containing protein
VESSDVETLTPTAVRRFPATASSVREARRFLLDMVPAASPDEADALVLLLSELATNAVQHAATEFEVAVCMAPDRHCVRVEVSDGAAGYPALQEQLPDAPRGRGLHIVRTLADAWGIEMRRDQPGKTVWFSVPLSASDGGGESAGLPGSVSSAATASVPAMATAPAGSEPAWPVKGVRIVLDGLRDAVVATDEQGTIRYVNVAAEELLGWPRGSLIGRSVFDLVPESLKAAMGDDYGEFVRTQAHDLVGRQLDAVIKRADGTDVNTELVISIFDHPLAGPVVVGILRPRDERKLQQWSELTSELLEILADAPIDEPPAERLLSTLGRRLNWDVTTLWALSANQELLCRHVWTRTPTIAPAFTREKTADPTSGSKGLPRWVMDHGEPLWVPDLMTDRRFTTDSLVQDGLQSAYAARASGSSRC